MEFTRLGPKYYVVKYLGGSTGLPHKWGTHDSTLSYVLTANEAKRLVNSPHRLLAIITHPKNSPVQLI